MSEVSVSTECAHCSGRLVDCIAGDEFCCGDCTHIYEGSPMAGPFDPWAKTCAGFSTVQYGTRLVNPDPAFTDAYEIRPLGQYDDVDRYRTGKMKINGHPVQLVQRIVSYSPWADTAIFNKEQ